MAVQEQQDRRFQLVNTLGKGGMAEVYLGWMNSIGGIRRKVAIKRILPELVHKQGNRFQKMFVDEARLAFQLEHDNIVRVYDVGKTQETFYIAMEYVEGFDLKHLEELLIEKNALFPLGVAIYIIMQVCAGLGYAHALTDNDGKPLGLIHNDISPPNILIGRHGEVKVADFGLADAQSNVEKTPDGMIKGKFAYISPESTRNPPKITSKSDIFSIGIVFWEMLAGRKLFQRKTDLETFKAVRAAQIPDIRRLRDDIPDPLVRIIHKSLAADPEKRYQTCEELYHDLSAIAIDMRLPVNRYDLEWLVNDLADNKWKEFNGEKISEDVLKKLENELDGLLNPEEAENLKGVVTGMSINNDVMKVENVSEDDRDWMNGLYDDIFDEDEINAKPGSEEKSAQEEPPHTSPDSKRTPIKDLPSEVRRSKQNSAVVTRHDMSGLLPSAVHTIPKPPTPSTDMAKVAPPKSDKAKLFGIALISFVLGLIAALAIVMTQYGNIISLP